MPTHTDTEFIGSAEVCRILKVHQATIGRWVAAGDLEPAHKLPGKNGAYLFRRSDIDELAAKRAAEASE
ncbi:helix-turn-helix transcriptional regulator [Mycobacterium aquaticum]|nr:helix-turn-helix domain-containing protein [Mycobacterium aquaticum]